jgi:flagellar biosynthetic protein FliR
MTASGALLNLTDYFALMQQYWWPFCRFMALFSMAPLFNHRAMSVRIRILLALLMSLTFAQLLPQSPQVSPISFTGVLLTIEQVFFGILLGLMLQLVFTTFNMIGEIISTQMGMAMARYNDPTNGVSSSSVVYQIYFVLLIFLLLTIDGHLLMVSILYQSFVYWPVGSGLLTFDPSFLLIAMGWMFSAAVLITLPVVFCMTLVQFTFGLLNRISPSMNLFSLGFPITILMGLFCIYITLPNMAEAYMRLTQDLLTNLGVIFVETQRG